MKFLLRSLRNFFQIFERIQRDKAVSYTEFELQSREHLFALIVLGQFAGYPLVPAPLMLELLPFAEDELQLLFSRLESDDELARVASMFEGEG